jgi:hypothetical protein
MNAPLDFAAMGPIARLVLALGAEDQALRMVVVLIAKLDASGTDADNNVLTMGGYVGMLNSWMHVETIGRQYLTDNGVSVLRAKEFYDTDGDFRGRSRERKEKFIRGLQDEAIVGRLDFGVALSVLKSKYLEAKRLYKVAQNESPFGFCFRLVIEKVLNDVVVKEVLKQGVEVTFILESGDNNAQDAERVWNQVKAISPWFDRVLNSFGFVDKKKSVGLQMGDFLAGTIRRYERKHSEQVPIQRNRQFYLFCATGFI